MELYKGAFAIDLGTSNSSISTFKNGRFETAAIDEDPENPNRLNTPTVITYLPNGTYVCGTQAVQLGARYPQSTIYYNKMYIGVMYKDLKRGSFNSEMIQSNCNGDIVYKIKIGCQTIETNPEQVYTDYLRWMIESAEKKTGQECKYLKISIPHNFSFAQVQATLRAASQVRPGITVLDCISEPMCSCLIYNEIQSLDHRYFLIFDIGGGTLDIALMDIHGDCYEVLGSCGDGIGGVTIDYVIFEKIVGYLRSQSCFREELMNDVYFLHGYLKKKAEQAKIELSSSNYTIIDFDEYGFERMALTRDTFESLISDLMTRMIDHCNYVLQSCRVHKTQLNGIILVGGSSHIPLIRKKLQEAFGDIVRCNVNVDTIVSQGALRNCIDHIYLERYKINPDIRYPFDHPVITHFKVVYDIGMSSSFQSEISVLFQAGDNTDQKKTIHFPIYTSRVVFYQKDPSTMQWTTIGYAKFSALKSKEITVYMDKWGYLKYQCSGQALRSIECDNKYSHEFIQYCQTIKNHTEKLIVELEKYRTYFKGLSQEKQDDFNKVLDDAVCTLNNTPLMYAHTVQEINQYVQRVIEYIRNRWYLFCLKNVPSHKFPRLLTKAELCFT